MSSETQKYRDLVNKLYERTAKNSLEWYSDQWLNKTAVALGQHILTIETGENAEGEPLVYVSIYSNSRAFIDNFNDEMLSGYQTDVEEFSTYWALMNYLHNAAQRKARGADKALDSVLEALDLDDDVPF